MQSSILNKILSRTEEKPDYFLALEIQEDKVKTAACEIKKGEVEVLSIGTKEYTGGSWEEATEAVNEVISQVEGKFAEGTSVNKVILGLPPEYTQDGKIAEPYLTNLKELFKKLSLAPLGFVEIPRALIHFLQKQEGGPQTLILVRISRQKVTVSLIRVGKISNNISVQRTDNLALDLEKAIASFPEVEILPSKILLYDGEDLENCRQELMSHPWLTRASFLHFPKIEIAPPDLDIKSIAFAGASEIAQVVEVTEAKETELLSKKTEVEKPETGREETTDFGFVKGEDILERESARETLPLPPKFAPVPQAMPVGRQAGGVPQKTIPSPRFTFPQVKIPKFLQFQKLKVLLSERLGWAILGVIFLFLFLGGGVVAAYWYIPTAKVNLILESQTLEKAIEVDLNPELTAVDETTKEIPGLALEVDEKGLKKATTTGKRLVGEPARGEVTIYNQTDNNKTFKKGTILISPNNLRFTLDDEVMVASASGDIKQKVSGKQNARVTAEKIGPEGNLGIGQQFHFADYPVSSYAAENSIAFSSGTSREISVVARADQESLLASASTELTEQAKRDLEGKVGAGEKILKETLTGIVTQKKFDKEVDEETTELSLEITMHFTAVGFRENDLLDFLEKTITTSIPAGFEFRREEVKMEVANITKKKDGSLLLKVDFTASLLPRINQEEIKKNLIGKSLTDADKYLRNLGNIAGFEVKFGRSLPFRKNILPRLPQNIKIETSGRK